MWLAEDEIDRLQSRLAEIEAEKQSILPRIEKLRTTTEVLGPILDDLETEEDLRHKGDWAVLAKCGIQECCTRVVYDTKGPMNAASIRDALVAHGIGMDYANPLAVIHTSLKRVSENVRSFTKQEEGANGKVVQVRYYEWIGPRALRPK